MYEAGSMRTRVEFGQLPAMNINNRNASLLCSSLSAEMVN